ncbi:MAG TPA: BON domain-containing protein [Candidatus Polarisedimenticolia bacterium]|nr:BON domain-containing protein [Candidatus Polarisedimenticolia bacterium]
MTRTGWVQGLSAMTVAGVVVLLGSAGFEAANRNHDRKGTRPAAADGDRMGRSTAAEDRELAADIREDLRDAEMIDIDDLEVDVRGGVVTLSGTAETLYAKEQAVDLARSYAKVDQVVDRLALRTRSRSDREIREDVEDALDKHARLDADDLDIEVRNGDVTLRGDLESQHARELASDIAKSVAGVRRVSSDLQVARAGRADRKDEDIETDIQRRLDRRFDEDEAVVDVEVTGGKVELDGMVTNARKKSEILDAVWVPGVIEVDHDNLKIDRDMRRVRTDSGRRSTSTHPRGSGDVDRAVRNDGDIEEDVRFAFDKDPMLAAEGPEVDVRAGVANLSGDVDTLHAKKRAEEIAGETPGVVQVRNQIRVERDEAVSDEELEDRVKQALFRDPFFERHRIGVAVDDGVVRLTGRVQSERERAAAEDIAAGIPGVVDVENDLTVSN